MVNIGHIFLWALIVVIASGTDLNSDDSLNDVLSYVTPTFNSETSLSVQSIEKIDVKCDQRNGMTVEVDFLENFNGIIYSQGYYNDPKCTYVAANKGDTKFIFNVPYDGCGSKPSCSICSSIENVLIIQNDKDIQNSWDIARKVACSRSEEQEKTVYFKPFVVDMLEVVSVDTPSGPVECWMEIGTGIPPNIKPISSTLKLGTDVTFTINVKHSTQAWDVNILKCYASDDMNFEARTTKTLQLSDKRGCTIKEKIFGEWKKLESQSGSSLTSTYYNTLKAFKFPDRSQVFLKCDIELCKGACQRDYSCSSLKNNIPIDGPKPRCYPGSEDPACLSTTSARPKITITTTKSRCYSGSTDPECQKTTYFPRTTTESTIEIEQPECYPGSTDPRCPQRPTPTTKPRCYPGSKDPDCLNCFPGSPDPRCPKVPTTKKAGCEENSDDPRCQPATYLPPSTFRTPTLSPKPRCYPGSRDPECLPVTYQPPTTRRTPTYTAPTTPRAPITTETPKCYPGSNDPRCPQRPATTIKPRCYPGSQDPECQPATYLPPTTRKTPVYRPKPSCYPGSTDPRCPQEPATTTKPRCYPGSSDPECVSPTYTPPTTRRTPVYTPPTTTRAPITTETPKCYPGSTDTRCPQRPATTTKPRCYPGSQDPDCQPATYLPPTTTKTPKPRCFPGSTDPRCPQEPATTQKPRCYPGSSDPECVSPTYTPPTTRRTPTYTTTRAPITTEAPKCYPGSNDPRCPQRPATTTKPRCYPGSQDPECLNCFPGSPDPRCPKVPTTKKAGCEDNSDDPRCQPATYLPPSTYRTPTLSPKPRCYPGSRDPECSPATNQPPTTRGTTTVPPKPQCYPGSTDPRCPQKPVTTVKPRCYPGTQDPECQPPTYLPPTTKQPPTYNTKPTRPVTTATPTDEEKLRCYSGSPDPRCKQDTTVIPSFNLVTSTQPPATTPTYCYPGSIDPRCPDSGYKGTSRIPATYLPPLSDPGYDRTIRNAKSSFFKEINQLAFTDNNVFEIDDDASESTRVKRELKDDDDDSLMITQEEDLLSRRIVKREFSERPSEREVISLTLGVRTGINVN
ncbi:adhesive plaque matrix protein isoform X1 [Drosophila subobscura]|uniref:adhesive plaque matrix protein isoform X1 n=1 Tax=Drosophila subobscura TaxID=7241 RepID=UPI00155A1FF3|nr:adhesive plaque matrix protein isoform X1 [Drosophila subobscura]